MSRDPTDYSKKFMSGYVWGTPPPEYVQMNGAMDFPVVPITGENFVHTEFVNISIPVPPYYHIFTEGFSYTYNSSYVPRTITYNFPDPADVTPQNNPHLLDYTLSYSGCDSPSQFPSKLQDITRGVFSSLASILPTVPFMEVGPRDPADINYIMCSNMTTAGNAADGIAIFPPDATFYYSHQPSLNSTVAPNNSSFPHENSLVMIKKDTYKNMQSAAFLSFIPGLSAIANIYSNYMKYILTHETGHAMGLLHDHTNGTQANPYLQSPYTSRSSVMSYTEAEGCRTKSTSTALTNFLFWGPVTPFMTDFGPLDKINLRYAYTNDAESIRPDQTDTSFPCPEKTDTPIITRALGLPATLYSLPAQISLGIIVAAISGATSLVAEKIDTNNPRTRDIVNFAKSLFNAPEPSPTASWHESMQNAAHELLLTAPRVILPFAALTHDVIYTASSNARHKGFLKGAASLLLSTGYTGIPYLASRAIGVPISSLYTFAEAAHKTVKSDDTTKTIAQRIANAGYNFVSSVVMTPVKLVTELRGVRHLIAGSALEKWVHRRRDVPSVPGATAPTMPRSPAPALDAEIGRGVGSINPETPGSPAPARNFCESITTQRAPIDRRHSAGVGPFPSRSSRTRSV